MIQRNKPIFQRGVKPVTTPSQPKRSPVTELTPEDLELKKLQHEDGWLHDHNDKPVRVVFADGEVLVGAVGKVRKFSFALHTSTGSVMIFKPTVKYVAEVL
jgi:sRNA-binding regulator protein Hfq